MTKDTRSLSKKIMDFFRGHFFVKGEQKFPHVFFVNIDLEVQHKAVRKFRIPVRAHDKQHALRIVDKEMKIKLKGATKAG